MDGANVQSATISRTFERSGYSVYSVRSETNVRVPTLCVYYMPAYLVYLLCVCVRRFDYYARRVTITLIRAQANLRPRCIGIVRWALATTSDHSLCRALDNIW